MHAPYIHAPCCTRERLFGRAHSHETAAAGAQDGKNLASLLHEMAGIEGVEWIRILYAYPSYFTDDLIAAIADIPQVCLGGCVLHERAHTWVKPRSSHH